MRRKNAAIAMSIGAALAITEIAYPSGITEMITPWH
jgi:hypothetical protein